MGKYEKRTPKRIRKGFIVIPALAVLAAVLAVLLLPREPELSEKEPGITETEATVPVTDIQITEFNDDTVPYHETEPKTETGDMGIAVEFPLSLEDGALEIESLFQFEGINPDCANREGDKTAAILVQNTSGLYLKSAAIWASLDDGSEVRFSVSDLPAGKGALVLSADHTQLADDRECTAFRADCVFDAEGSMEGVSVSVDGTAITVTNETDKEITGIDIYCHGVFGDLYYGGVTYVYRIENLPAGERATITADDCVIGVADVVRVAGQ